MADKTQAVVVGTWAFAAQPVAVAAKLAAEGESCVECLEKALNVAEEDEQYGPYQVGRGGPPNEKGEVELDAALMSGHGLSFGAVTALQGIPRASSVARCVMERSQHSMLTAQGAQDFALQHGFHLDMPPAQNITGDGDRERQGSGERRGQADQEASHLHDTLGLIVLDVHGNIAAGVTTSGMRNKARGRIGDSALPGCGLYADNQVGAVCCSGEGDEILKFCPSFLVMESMRQGMSPEAACQAAIKRIQQRVAPARPFELAIVAVSARGEVGAASTVTGWTDTLTGHSYPGFPYVVWRAGDEGFAEPRTLVVEHVSS
ncbi:N(4)-(Beta-N-acetylglucosaminyl)-L-asparaginase-like [Babylonia areolata]|uniref:N(4)-(Beta-N-acetylglucosaminyl)-L-asparaginase- like n=1 Tax=Babylonia areolata TaxID=304850 RepID=UPI003FD417BB